MTDSSDSPLLLIKSVISIAIKSLFIYYWLLNLLARCCLLLLGANSNFPVWMGQSYQKQRVSPYTKLLQLKRNPSEEFYKDSIKISGL